MKKIFLLLFLFSLRTWGQAPNATETVKPHGESFTVYVENDTRRLGGPNSDQGYTNGIRFSYVYAENKIPAWIPPLTGWSERLNKEFNKSTTNFGVSLAQQIYTPNNKNTAELIKNDRPYAGWLYLGFTANFKTPTHSHSLELDIGVIGPEAMGEKVQNSFHDMINVPDAKGWKNQLSTEPTLQASYFQKIRFFELENESGRSFDFIPYGGASFGNVLIAGHIGAIARLGVRLPDDFGPSRLSSADGDAIVNFDGKPHHIPWRVYGFAGIRGNAIARNIFLDGNTFRDSHRVKKYPFTAETEVGYAVQISHWSYSWRFVTVSPEFEEKSEFSSYASISLSYFRDFE
ncbi:lipid A deacylase LpxR family protein [Bdellovibrio sp. HCB-162]|uniref:lipid A deacylase LpxR family protein n=1 Tax=Bdellovibrio sp. HCB-162 TaxID=3394234 RepID=UPI0039BC673E